MSQSKVGRAWDPGHKPRPQAETEAQPEPPSGTPMPEFIQAAGQTPSSVTQSRFRGMLNGARVASPLVAALLRRPGITAGGDEMHRAVEQITRLHQEVTERVLAEVLPNRQNDATRAMMARPVAGLVADYWDLGESDADDPRQAVERLSGFYVDLIRRAGVLPDQVFEDIDPDLDLSLATAQAAAHGFETTSRLYRLPETSRALFIGRDLAGEPHRLLERVGADIRRLAEEVVTRFDESEEGSLTEKDRRIGIKSVMSATGRVYGSALASEYVALGRELRAMKPEDRKRYRETIDDTPGGHLRARALESVRLSLTTLYPRPDTDPAEEDPPSP